MWRRTVLLVILVVVLLLALFRIAALTKIPCGYVGVRWSQFGGSADQRGEVRLLRPGLRFKLPLIHRLELLSTALRKIDLEHVEITLKDKLKAYLDATVSFRVEPTQLAVRFAANDGEQYISRVMPNDVRRIVRDVLEQADADVFLDPSWRNQQIDGAKQQILEVLRQNGITLARFFLRDFAFTASFEQELKRARQSRQRIEVQALKTRLSALEAQGDQELSATRTEIENVKEQARRHADAISHQSSLAVEGARLQGEFLVSRARLEGQKMMNEVLQGVDSDAVAKMELAEVMSEGLSFVVLGSSGLGISDLLGPGLSKSGKEKVLR